MRVIVSAAVSADGYMDDLSPRRLILSGEEDWREVYRLRAGCDAILVGAQTIRSDNPALVIRDEQLRRERIANGLPGAITKITVTGSGRLDPTARFFTEGADAPKIVFTREDTPQENIDRLVESVDSVEDVKDVEDTGMPEASTNRVKGANSIEVVRLPEISAKAIVENLAARGIKRLMVEGGAQIIKMFIDEDAVDEFRLAVSPVIVGEPAAVAPVMMDGSADTEQIIACSPIVPRLPYFGNLPFEQRAEKTVRNVGNMRVTEYVIIKK